MSERTIGGIVSRSSRVSRDGRLLKRSACSRLLTVHDAVVVRRTCPGGTHDRPGREAATLRRARANSASSQVTQAGPGCAALPIGLGLAAGLPAIPSAIASIIGNGAGCTLSEDDVHPCVIAGIDLGLPLTLMAPMGWGVIAMLPVMALTLVAGVVWGGVRIGLAWRRSGVAASVENATRSRPSGPMGAVAAPRL